MQALEIVFIMLILIVVALVVIKFVVLSNPKTSQENFTLSNCKLDKSTTPWSFTCDTNCKMSSAIVVEDNNKTTSSEINPDVNGNRLTAQPSLKNTLNELKCPGIWNVILVCEDPNEYKASSLNCS